MPDGNYNLVNLQDERQGSDPYSFDQDFLQHDNIKSVLKSKQHRDNFRNLLNDKVIEVKASNFGNAIDNAIEDFRNPARCSLLLQHSSMRKCTTLEEVNLGGHGRAIQSD